MPEYVYTRWQQTKDYRHAAWDLGCTCGMLPPHVHDPACPLYEKPAEMAERLEEEHLEP